MLPATCGAVPSKSTCSSSPASRTRAVTGMSVVSMPSPSIQSVKLASPSATSASTARTVRSAWSSVAAIASASSSGPWRATRSTSRRAATRLAPACARRSPIRSSGVRVLASSSARTSRSSCPPRTNRTGGILRPSANTSVASAGIDPGAEPPTSEWWARLATYPTRRPSTSTGATRVQSGRWVPPANGSESSTWSSWARSGNAAMAACTDAGIEPRWTGMCSAWATMRACASNTAVEQSIRSLMLGEDAVRRSAAPASSATPTSALRTTSRVIGSTCPGRRSSWVTASPSRSGAGPRRRRRARTATGRPTRSSRPR